MEVATGFSSVCLCPTNDSVLDDLGPLGAVE